MRLLPTKLARSLIQMKVTKGEKGMFRFLLPESNPCLGIYFAGTTMDSSLLASRTGMENVMYSHGMFFQMRREGSEPQSCLCICAPVQHPCCSWQVGEGVIGAQFDAKESVFGRHRRVVTLCSYACSSGCGCEVQGVGHHSSLH